MKFTKDWLDVHLKSKKRESQIIDKLNNIGLEVEKIEPINNELSTFIIAKIIKASKHPNADRLKLCEVDIGENKVVKVKEEEMKLLDSIDGKLDAIAVAVKVDV